MSTTQINRDFRIKVYDRAERINSLRGVSGLVDMIGQDLFNKLVARAYASGQDKTARRLRRGLVVTFYVK